MEEAGGVSKEWEWQGMYGEQRFSEAVDPNPYTPYALQLSNTTTFAVFFTNSPTAHDCARSK
jgi:hypothetical protein